MKVFMAFLLLLSPVFAMDDERLAASHLEKKEWDKALAVAEKMCLKDVPIGCSLAGSALLGKGKIREAHQYQNLACDKFEPFACRSLARQYLKAEEKGLAHIYFKRACHYGLSESCGEIKETDQWYSPAALTLIGHFRRDCFDPESGACKSDFATVKACEAPLTKIDCMMVAGYLSILFRAKLLQAGAKVRLFSVHASQLAFSVKSRPKAYTYDLGRLLRGSKALERYHYVFGFMKGCGKKYVRARSPVTHSQEIFPRAYRHIRVRPMANILDYFKKGSGEDCYPPNSGYEAYAVGSLDPLNPARLDVWKIDQDKRMELVLDGSPLP